ncbi:MAG: hypothetical protein FWD54_07250 [Endomicrobia bacterium]|nr:hypothetical protein [Endomicrobiia bacterium]MCL2800049.1 hypothetical protein [Endomicrobiia bacterium]
MNKIVSLIIALFMLSTVAAPAVHGAAVVLGNIDSIVLDGGEIVNGYSFVQISKLSIDIYVKACKEFSLQGFFSPVESDVEIKASENNPVMDVCKEHVIFERFKKFKFLNESSFSGGYVYDADMGVKITSPEGRIITVADFLKCSALARDSVGEGSADIRFNIVC